MPADAFKIMVADDDPAMRRGLCAALKAVGYTVEEARDGEQAIRMFRERPSDLVFFAPVSSNWTSAIVRCERTGTKYTCHLSSSIFYCS
jgi:DNA-binding NarL/FixJ family response regulator